MTITTTDDRATIASDHALCATEPIHTPGAIQPHGALLAARMVDGVVTHASANLRAFLPHTPQAALGCTLEALLGRSVCRELLGEALRDGTDASEAVLGVGAHERSLQLRAFRSGRLVCVDIEPLLSTIDQRPALSRVQSVLGPLRHAANAAELCELAVLGLKLVSGYDRVMAYRFGDDGHGEVVAEARASHLPAFLGLRYPASDIPPQARRLYLAQRVGTIADASYRAVPLIAAAEADAAALDLTRSTLRSVSPLHCEYMRNMQTAASLTIGLADQDVLWGMLVCHHATPRVAGPELRAVAEIVGQVMSLLLESLGRGRTNALRLERDQSVRALVRRLSHAMPLRAALEAAEPDLLAAVDASGVLVSHEGQLFVLGSTPPLADAIRAMDSMNAKVDHDVLATDCLGHFDPALAGCARDGSGALLLPRVPQRDLALLWFRPERSRTVVWGGNPDAHERADPSTGRLSPRKSFEAWTEHVSGRSDPWSDIDLAVAGEIGMAIAAELAQRAKAELARLRHYDPLTGLPNRSLFNERLAQVDTGVDGPVALLFFDLDRFKAVNDTLGHAAGDALLIQVARRLMSAIGPDHLAARLGGDEFVVLCRGCDAKGAAALGERIRVAVEAPFEILGQPCRIAASIGVATSGPMGGIDLVKAADIAMYAAKKGGGNRVIVSDPSLYASAAWHLEFDQDLRESLGRDDQFVLFYQPVFSIAGASRTLIGFESLLRWNHPKQGWMEPHQLIPHAKRSGLLPDLGRWVIEHALRRGHILRRHGPALWISVNVSGCELASAGFCEALDARLRAASYPPIALCLEVTQSAPNDPALSAVLGDVRRLGVRVAIDEFGIGYSSLSYLRRLPVDVVKLDRSLLQHVDGDARATTFVGAVVALAHAAGMAVTAEGIETQAELDFAVAAGIGAAQGFLFEKPLSGAAAELFAANWSDAAKPRPARA